MVKIYINWGDVVNTTREQMWIQVKEKFNVPSGQENRFHGFVLTTLQHLYRYWKSRLHQIYKKFGTDEVKLANIPVDVNFEDWELLIHHFGSKKFQEKFHDLVMRQPEDQESQLTRDEMLLQVFGEKPGYFRGKGAGKKPSKRVRFQKNMQEEVQRAV